MAKAKVGGAFNVDRIRKDFPILKTKMNGKPLVYLDNAATSQKPSSVIDAIGNYYRTYNANIHRGIYKIAEEATIAYTDSKVKLEKFINANSMQEIVYTKNATDAINLVSLSWGGANVGRGDHILVSSMEHHSNLVPWMVLAKKKGAVLDYIALDKDNARLSTKSLDEQLEKRPKIVAVTHASNVLGTINDVKSITRKAHGAGAMVIVDGAQSAPHMKVDVRDIDCDFFAMSAHKMLGPMGIGALYAKKGILDSMEPLITGGDMIRSVTHNSYSWNDLPWKFEAGTSDVSGAVGFGAAIDYLNAVGMDKVRKHEKEITKYALKRMNETRNVRTFGLDMKGLEDKCGIIAFSLKGVHPHDVSQILDGEGIAIRAGQHCAMPLVTEILNENALSRISFYLYNKESEVDKVIDAIDMVKKKFRIE